MKFIKNIILNNFFIKLISLVLALFAWSYIGGQLYKESLGRETDTASLSMVDISGEDIVVKKLPIYAKIMGEPAQDYKLVLSRISVRPSYSVIAGPADTINNLTYISTEPINVQGRNNSFKGQAKIADIPGCKVNYEGSVKVTIPISRARKR
ncbi:MAG: YbbR-like domain-containing protein [Candidatus Omnitrophica bacterium]|nr:YbbR-like domain-containing protein [Candidatus Omnitrophota bacterium]